MQAVRRLPALWSNAMLLAAAQLMAARNTSIVSATARSQYFFPSRPHVRNLLLRNQQHWQGQQHEAKRDKKKYFASTAWYTFYSKNLAAQSRRQLAHTTPNSSQATACASPSVPQCRVQANPPHKESARRFEATEEHERERHDQHPPRRQGDGGVRGILAEEFVGFRHVISPPAAGTAYSTARPKRPRTPSPWHHCQWRRTERHPPCRNLPDCYNRWCCRFCAA